MLIDVNCSLGWWPFQRFRQDTAGKLARHLASEGVSRALVSAVENVLYPDPHVYNRLLLKKLKPYPGLVPIMVLNPSLSHWQECLDAYDAAETGHAVKILPNYHRYSLDAPCVAALMEALARKPKRVLIVQMRVEDERNQYPPMKIPGVSVEEIIALANRFPKVRIVCLCSYRREAASLVKETENVYVDTAFLEFLNTLRFVTDKIPAGRLLFGSNTPILYTRSNIMKVRCAEIPRRDLRAISSANARRLFRLPGVSDAG